MSATDTIAPAILADILDPRGCVACCLLQASNPIRQNHPTAALRRINFTRRSP